MVHLTNKFFALLVTISSFLLFTSAHAMTDMTGKPSSLNKYTGKGKWVVAEVWHSECGVCKKSMPELVRSVNSMPNTRLVGISVDGNRAKANDFVKQFKVNFPTLITNVSDFSSYLQRLAKKPLRGAPTYLIFDPKGNLKALQSGNIKPSQIKAYIQKQDRKLKQQELVKKKQQLQQLQQRKLQLQRLQQQKRQQQLQKQGQQR